MLTGMPFLVCLETKYAIWSAYDWFRRTDKVKRNWIKLKTAWVESIHGVGKRISPFHDMSLFRNGWLAEYEAGVANQSASQAQPDAKAEEKSQAVKQAEEVWDLAAEVNQLRKKLGLPAEDEEEHMADEEPLDFGETSESESEGGKSEEGDGDKSDEEAGLEDVADSAEENKDIQKDDPESAEDNDGINQDEGADCHDNPGGGQNVIKGCTNRPGRVSASFNDTLAPTEDRACDSEDDKESYFPNEANEIELSQGVENDNTEVQQNADAANNTSDGIKDELPQEVENDKTTISPEVSEEPVHNTEFGVEGVEKDNDENSTMQSEQG